MEGSPSGHPGVQGQGDGLHSGLGHLLSPGCNDWQAFLLSEAGVSSREFRRGTQTLTTALGVGAHGREREMLGKGGMGLD